jgi:predicted Ser/Thr protein kinase
MKISDSQYDYEILSEIARGKTSTVFFVKSQLSRKELVMKVLTQGKERIREFFFKNEIEILKKLKPA